MKGTRSAQLAAAAVAILLCGGVAAAGESWKLAKDAEGVKVYTRDVPNSQLEEFRGEIELGTTVDRVVKVLKDPKAFRKWMPDVIASEGLSSSGNEQVHYMENSAPWPVSNRDGVYRFNFSRSEKGSVGGVVVHVQAVPDYIPPRKGKVRVPRSDGFWEIDPSASGVKVTYQMHADPGGSIPTWMANSASVSSPFNTLKNLRAYIQSAPER
jgi:hypothetical protein